MLRDDGKVPTVFWVDNFDCIIESVTGGGSVNTTHMMVFHVERAKKRKFTANDLKGSLIGIKIDPEVGPPNLSTPGENFQDTSQIQIKYFIWLLLRKIWNQRIQNRK